jgi:transcriptional regulator with XRE-family HTH domain
MEKHVQTKPYTSLHERMRAVRKELGWDIEKLAEIIGCSAQQLYFIESGVIPRPREIDRIAAGLNVNPAWLQFGSYWASKQRPE